MDDALSVLRAGAAQSEIRELERGAPFLTLPPDYEIQSLEFLLDRPLIRRGELEFFDSKDFGEFAHKYRHPNTVAMWHRSGTKARKKGKDPRTGEMLCALPEVKAEYKMTVVFDFHEAGMGVESELARQWAFQIYIKFTKKDELNRLIKELKNKSNFMVMNCFPQRGPYIIPVTQEYTHVTQSPI